MALAKKHHQNKRTEKLDEPNMRRHVPSTQGQPERNRNLSGANAAILTYDLSINRKLSIKP